MAFSAMRAAQLFDGAKRLAQVPESSLEVESGDEPLFGSDILLGFSSGIAMATVTFTELILVRGMESRFRDAMKRKKSVTVRYAAGGKTYSLEMRVTRFKITSSSRSGMVTGEFTLQGGDPDELCSPSR